jgi:hypothetical protein
MNPASRLLAIYDRLVQQNHPNGTQWLAVWANVFEFKLDTQTAEDDAIVCLQALRAEIDFVRMRLNTYGVPDDLTNPGFFRLREVASPAFLLSAWEGSRGNITPPENRLSFQWASWVLRDEDEADMSIEDMIELDAELSSLEAALRDTDMSPYMRDFVQRQVDAIRAALRVCRVQGARPLREALKKAAGDLTVDGKRIEAEWKEATPEAKSVFAKATGAIEKTAKVCDNLEKITKFGEHAWTLAGTVGPLVLPYIAKTLGGG